MNYLYHKSCVVPQCRNTNIKTPDKLFIYVPSNTTMRKKWLTLARRSDAQSKSTKSNLYFCEDHFDLPNDMLNYTEYRIMGKISQMRMRPGCIPSRFACQEDRRKRTTNAERSYFTKKQRKRIVEECLNETEESGPSSSHKDACLTSSVDTSPLNLYEAEETKYNIMKRDGEYCGACLSADRILSPMRDVNDYTELIINIMNNLIKDPQELELCWECLAELKRIEQFKSRIEMAQSVLGYQCEQEERKIKSLSRLSVTHTDTMIFMIHEDEEAPLLCNIKEEIEFDDDLNISHDQEDIDIPPLDTTAAENDFEYELKVENVETQEIKKKQVEAKTNKTKKNRIVKVDYRFIYGPNNFKRSSLRKRLDIPPEDVPSWIDNEKNSWFYKSLNFKCKLCYYGNHSRQRINEHYSQCHDESIGPHICSTCSSRFQSHTTMLAHTQKHARAYACTLCGHQCYTLKGMNVHIDSHRMVQCAYCEMVLPTVGEFRVHQKAYHKEFVCDHCNKVYRSKYMAEKHIIRYHLSPHICADCGRVYRSRPALLKHRFTKHTICKPELSYCVLCNKQFKNVYLYRRHVQTSNAHVSEFQET